MVAFDLYGLAEGVEADSARLAVADDPVERVFLLARLAWHQRQRDTLVALEHVGEATELMARIVDRLDPDQARLLSARLLLAKAEGKILYGQEEQAEGLLAAAQEGFAQAEDAIGRGDAAMVEALLAGESGQARRRAQAHQRACDFYEYAGDVTRTRIARAWVARDLLFKDPTTAASAVEAMPQGVVLEDPGLGAISGYCHGGLRFARGDFPLAARHYQRGYEQALLAGCLRLAITLASNVGAAYANMNDHAGELFWRERAHALAVGAGWPAAIAQGLRGMGDSFRRLNQPERARAMLQEALHWLEPWPHARGVAIICQYLGALEQEEGHWQEALAYYERLYEIANALEHSDLQIEAEARSARIFMALGDRDAALAKARNALSMVRRRDDRWRAVDVLRLRADFHLRFPDAAAARPTISSSMLPDEDEPPVGADPVLHFLMLAHERAQSMQGHGVAPDLLTDLSAAYERTGDIKQALFWERRAGRARSDVYNREVTDRLVALQADFETERMKAEAAFHRHLAQAEAARAASLHEATQILELLVRVGQEITATLDQKTAFETLHRHLSALLRMNACSIYMADRDAQTLTLRYGEENGQPLPMLSRRIDDPVSPIARCARTRAAFLMNNEEAEAAMGSLIPGTLPMRTLMLAPLLAGRQLIGVVTAQSIHANAYGERDQLVFRSLAAYGAVALSNAIAYDRVDHALSVLKATQSRLVQQEKHASLGQLVTGLAHEINTPLGIAVTMASHLLDEKEMVSGALAQGQLTRNAMTQFMDNLGEGLRILSSNLGRAADLVGSFKQVAVDRGSEAVRNVELSAYLGDVLRSLEPLIRSHGARVQLDATTPVTITTRPGLFSQVIVNLIQNALLHAFIGDAAAERRIDIRLRQSQDMAAIDFVDNGIGMDEGVKAKAFDPFFTTKRDSGGAGLGLHIVHNLVTGPLSGMIDLHSAPGHGTSFLIRLPLRLPDHGAP
jgi:signal transduction histidine kinase/tetratricopeptide (TPR) repeat protein